MSDLCICGLRIGSSLGHFLHSSWQGAISECQTYTTSAGYAQFQSVTLNAGASTDFSHYAVDAHILCIVEKHLSVGTELNCHFFLPQSFHEKGDYLVMLVVKLTCYVWHLLPLNGTRESGSVGFPPSFTLHIFFSILFISEKEATGDFFKREASNRNKCSVHVKQIVILKHKPKSLRSFCHDINPVQYFLKNSLKNDLLSHICST